MAASRPFLFSHRFHLSKTAAVRSLIIAFARVAQLDRASASGAEGCGFDPRLAYQFFILPDCIIGEILGST